MNRCTRCSAPVPEGMYYCLPSRSFDGDARVKFNGCSALRTPVIKPRAGKKNNPKGAAFVSVPEHPTREVESAFEAHSIPLSNQTPLWMILDQMHCKSTPRYDKYAAGSVWTNERYGFGWSRFSRVVHLIAKEQRINLVGIHVPTIALADVVEGRLIDLSRAMCYSL